MHAVFDQETARWSSTTILNSAEISNSEYHYLLLIGFLEDGKTIRRKEYASMSPSPSKSHKQEVQKQKTHFEKKLQERNSQIRNMKLKLSNMKENQLTLEQNIESGKKQVLQELSEKDHELSKKNEEIETLEQHLTKQNIETDEIIAPSH